MSRRSPVILQGHMDMVCEKEPGCTKDMAAEGLDLVLEGDTVSARGTTLAGDDGHRRGHGHGHTGR